MSHLVQGTNVRLIEGDDLQGRIVTPGFLSLQMNGTYYGFDFSEDITGDTASYNSRFREARRKLITFKLPIFA
ncbi:uncharacterized protein N7498_006882 [Penicillium cinerascens]|uniref:Uncharacterized protein n=1 Tax=Penicillium cinerascens TaxID=70096 RepID=A0A9W9JIT4_9EURO|nr:uncharacterized protein N7498_006882 [Penicillium cinerascens]KAJ5197765.1 hypothetical protein N7498_006882 [Penicillium cinerascens]